MVLGMERRFLPGTTVGVVLLVALALAACGGGNDDVLGLGDRGLDRCSLITAEEAEGWLGALVEDPAPSDGFDGEPDPITCSYRGSDARVLLQIRDGEPFFAEEGSSARGETFEGLGEDAHVDNDSVRFLQNDWAVSVDYIGGRMDFQELVEMAELISSRLP